MDVLHEIANLTRWKQAVEEYKKYQYHDGSEYQVQHEEHCKLLDEINVTLEELNAKIKEFNGSR